MSEHSEARGGHVSVVAGRQHAWQGLPGPVGSGTMLVTPPRPATLAEQVQALLACPRCHAGLTVSGADVRCAGLGCGQVGALLHDVAVFGDRSGLSFFDDRHETMAAGNLSGGVRCLCYDRQAAVVEGLLRPGARVLDVGCGPTLPYEKPSGAFVIGLEASYESIRVNQAVDLRVYGTAVEIPLPKAAVDVVLAYYAVHHMTGRTVAANRRTVIAAFREFRRVTRPGGEILVFEVSPWPALWLAERTGWNVARRLLGPRLDMFFYPADGYAALGRAALPGAAFSVRRFDAPMLSAIPPVFSLPWLKIPRFLYPFDVNLYRWTV